MFVFVFLNKGDNETRFIFSFMVKKKLTTKNVWACAQMIASACTGQSLRAPRSCHIPVDREVRRY